MYFVCSSRITHFDPCEPLLLALVGRRSHKNLDRGRHVRCSDSLNFLRAGDFGRTRPCHSPCVPSHEFIVLTVPRPFKGATIERTACMTRSTELGRLKTVFLLRFRRQQGRQAPKGWHELSSLYEERGISMTFVGWLLCDFNREMCRKDTNNGD